MQETIKCWPDLSAVVNLKPIAISGSDWLIILFVINTEDYSVITLSFIRGDSRDKAAPVRLIYFQNTVNCSVITMKPQ